MGTCPVQQQGGTVFTCADGQLTLSEQAPGGIVQRKSLFHPGKGQRLRDPAAVRGKDLLSAQRGEKVISAAGITQPVLGDDDGGQLPDTAGQQPVRELSAFKGAAAAAPFFLYSDFILLELAVFSKELPK